MDVRSFFAVFCLFIGALDGSERRASRSLCHGSGAESFHDFSAKDLDGNTVSMSEFTGHVVLAVNVATFWEYTYQYLKLNALQEDLLTSKDGNTDACGLRIVGFPCNQFGYQEPAKNKYEILNGLKYVRPGHGFEPTFPLFEKIDVNGKNEDEIYSFFKVSSVFCRYFLFAYIFFYFISKSEICMIATNYFTYPT